VGAGDPSYSANDNPDDERASSGTWERPQSTTGVPFTHRRWMQSLLFQVRVGWAPGLWLLVVEGVSR
jgi:hypothetical protein